MNEKVITTLEEKSEAKPTEINKATKRWEEAKTEWVAIFNTESSKD